VRWQFVATVDTSNGSYAVEFRSLDEPGGGVDYEQLVAMLKQILRDLDRRVATERAKSDGDSAPGGKIHLVSDDSVTN